jgi:hypothetical protein
MYDEVEVFAEDNFQNHLMKSWPVCACVCVWEGFWTEQFAVSEAYKMRSKTG